jgi:hypothetical protein
MVSQNKIHYKTSKHANFLLLKWTASETNQKTARQTQQDIEEASDSGIHQRNTIQYPQDTALTHHNDYLKKSVIHLCPQQ